ncbi:hypothetical protein DS745_03420 [Anaerobacillus alkaliphilus]|uniref:Uncharacterized protein n=1 Tax=Anaerobacillus alkaliphilus TaxID=1548597 RepID=A0A4Q0VZK1_9BACI|nr:hypothetical protein [Anaerobacillus alkaliphilus]RXJ04448.1 hypothetical protein DS745_03420 [Anaerobacillus alkaliphilus]
MKWSEVRKLYPNQFVKLKSLSSHIKGGQEIIDDMALISPVPDDIATKELLKSKGDELVYHTIHENIVLEIRQDIGLRRFDYNENQI